MVDPNAGRLVTERVVTNWFVTFEVRHKTNQPFRHNVDPVPKFLLPFRHTNFPFRHSNYHFDQHFFVSSYTYLTIILMLTSYNFISLMYFCMNPIYILNKLS